MKSAFFVIWLFVTSTNTVRGVLGNQWPSMNDFTFSLVNPPVSTMLDGCSTTECNLENGASVPTDQQLGDLAMFSGKYSATGTCFPWAPNCSSGYLVKKGEIDNGSGLNNIPAYIVHPPTNPATIFTASKSALMFKFSSPLAQSYDIIKYDPNGGVFSHMDTITPTNADTFYQTTAEVWDLTASAIYFAVDSTNTPSIWPDAIAGTTTRKATVFTLNTQGVQLSLKAQLFRVSPSLPFDPESGWNQGPDTHNHKYGFRKVFTRVVQSAGAGDGVIWQDQSTWKIFLTWFIPSGHNTIELQNQGSDHLLICAASDGGTNGDIIYLTVSASLDNQTKFMKKAEYIFIF